MSREELLAELMVERYGRTVPEWHGVYGIPVDWQDVIRRRAEAAAVAEESDVEGRQ